MDLYQRHAVRTSGSGGLHSPVGFWQVFLIIPKSWLHRGGIGTKRLLSVQNFQRASSDSKV